MLLQTATDSIVSSGTFKVILCPFSAIPPPPSLDFNLSHYSQCLPVSSLPLHPFTLVAVKSLLGTQVILRAFPLDWKWCKTHVPKSWHFGVQIFWLAARLHMTCRAEMRPPGITLYDSVMFNLNAIFFYLLPQARTLAPPFSLIMACQMKIECIYLFWSHPSSMKLRDMLPQLLLFSQPPCEVRMTKGLILWDSVPGVTNVL